MNAKHVLALTSLFFSSFLTLAPTAQASGCPNEYFTEECSCSPPEGGHCIASGNPKLTYFKIASDLADIVSPDAGFSLKPLDGGSIQNVKRMRWQNGVKMSIVQSDVMEYYKEEANRGLSAAQELIDPLRVILPLYNEEVHVLVKKDSPIKTFGDLKGKRLAIGLQDSGSSMTAHALYQLMFGESLPDAQVLYSDPEEALKALALETGEKSVDAWITVVGQPASIFTAMKPEATNLVRLIPFDAQQSNQMNALKGPYYPRTIKASSYTWMEQDVPTLAVKAFLITQTYQSKQSGQDIRRFTQSLCRNFSKLQQQGHPKWQETKLEKSELPGGWQYSDDVLAAFKSADCQLDGDCTDKAKVLGLCQ